MVQLHQLRTVTQLVKDQLKSVVVDCVLGDAVFVSGGVVEGRREERIKGDTKRVFQHTWDDSLEDQTVDLEAGICVDLNQPRLEVAVYHEIETKYLEIVAPAVWLQELERSPYRVCSYLFELGKDFLLKIVANVGCFWQ